MHPSPVGNGDARLTSQPGFVDCTVGLIALPLMEVISRNYASYPFINVLLELINLDELDEFDEFDEFEDLLFDELIIILDEFR